MATKQLYYQTSAKINKFMLARGFQQTKVPTRTFDVELKHRPLDDTTGDREELVK